MRAIVLAAALLVSSCAQPPWVGVVITNAPSSLGSCMPEKPGGGCP